MKLEEVSVEGGGRALLVRLGFATGGEDEDANGTPAIPLTEGSWSTGECCGTVTFCMQIDWVWVGGWWASPHEEVVAVAAGDGGTGGREG